LENYEEGRKKEGNCGRKKKKRGKVELKGLNKGNYAQK
jgi:hypothetical protein